MPEAANSPEAANLPEAAKPTPAAPPPGTTPAAPPPGTTPAAAGSAPGRAAPGGAGLDDDVKRALTWILKSTAARPQTEAEIATKLRTKGFDDDVAASALQEAKRLRAIDDEAFAFAWVEDRGRNRGFGLARLRQELVRRQVPAQLIDDALGALEERDDLATATELARGRFQRLPASLRPEAVARRLVGFLVRRGYPPALAQRVARDVSGLDRSWD